MVSFAPSWSQPYSQPSQVQLVGTLHEKDNRGQSLSIQRVYASQEILIGRDANRCQHVVHDAVVSNKHLRIYTIVFDDNQSDGVAPLVYAEDLSRNGTYWNNSLIGRGNGGVLLSNRDTLRISPRIYYHFQGGSAEFEEQPFDLTQECEMKHFETEYNVSDRKLGSGACGEVFMAIEQSRRTQLACKIVDLRKLKSSPRIQIGRSERAAAAEDVDSQAQMAKIKSWAKRKQNESRLAQQLKVYYREARILSSLSHPNIIGIEKVYVTDNSIYIFQDLITGGDLFSFLERKNGKLSDVEAAVIVRQILVALEYLHDQNIVHRDLKPENILMTALASGCRVVLTDFGHAKKMDNDRTRMTTMAGTEQYIAPEIAGTSGHPPGKTGYTKAVDIWSLGCVTVVLLTGGSPFVSQRTNQYCQRLAQECDLQQLDGVAEWQLVGKRPKDFVKRLLVLDDEQRMSAKDAKNHPWFSNEFHKVDFEELYHRAIKHWKPRTLKAPTIEMIDADQLKELPMLQKNDLAGQRNNRKRNLVPVDPPYKPYPRRMSLALLPKRRQALPFTMPDEVVTAIRERWSPEKVKAPTLYAVSTEIPALIPDTEASDLGRPRDEQETPKSGAILRRRAALTTPFKPLVQKELGLDQDVVSHPTTPPEISTIENVNQALPEASLLTCHSHTSSDASNRKELGRSLEAKACQLALADLTRGDCNSVTAKALTKQGETDRVIGHAASTNGNLTFRWGKGEMGFERSLDVPPHPPSGRADEIAEGQNFSIDDSGQTSSAQPCSPLEESTFKVAVDIGNLARTDSGTLERKSRPSKLRSPMRSCVDATSERTSITKRKRGSIYDLESDEDTEQAQHGLRRLTLGADCIMLGPRSVPKKARAECDEQVR